MKSVSITLIFVCCAVLFTQGQPKEIQLENGKKFLLGKIDISDLHSEPYENWFSREKASYSVDESLVKLYKKNLVKYNIKVFMGTWCGDSKREVPRFIKILEVAKFPMEQLEIVALDGRREFYKAGPNGEESGFNIVKVPTFIFEKKNKEVNRIIERPIESLEEDMETIVNGKNYIPNYHDATRTW